MHPSMSLSYGIQRPWKSPRNVLLIDFSIVYYILEGENIVELNLFIKGEDYGIDRLENKVKDKTRIPSKAPI